MNSALLGMDDDAGFSLRNRQRNENLLKEGFEPPNARKSGTTIVGVVFADGIVLASDSKSAGHVIFDHAIPKIYYVQDNIYCCGAGLVADMIMTADYISSCMELKRRNANRKALPVVMSVTMASQYLYSYKLDDVISAHLIFGGVDLEGPHIYSVFTDGFYSKEPYVSTGSGGYDAMAVLETRWRPDMTEAEGIKLARDAIAAGIMNDLGSGANVDIAVVRQGYHKLYRPYEYISKKGSHALNYTPKRGTTGVLSVKKFDIDVVDEVKMIF